jgi:hypothetical protein
MKTNGQTEKKCDQTQTEKNGLHMEQYMYVKDITVSTTNPHVQARDFYTHKSF